MTFHYQHHPKTLLTGVNVGYEKLDRAGPKGSNIPSQLVLQFANITKSQKSVLSRRRVNDALRGPK